MTKSTFKHKPNQEMVTFIVIFLKHFLLFCLDMFHLEYQLIAFPGQNDCFETINLILHFLI